MKWRRPVQAAGGRGHGRTGGGHPRHRPAFAVLAALLVAAVGSGCAAETGEKQVTDPARAAAANSAATAVKASSIGSISEEWKA
ncbi:hypothetical protein [Streptomyces sp. NPDC002530]